MNDASFKTNAMHGVFRILLLVFFIVSASFCKAQDLDEIKARGVLRHLGVPYARFVVSGTEGLDVEIIRMFAEHLGVRYEYVPADWLNVIQDLIGQELEFKPVMRAYGSRPVRGDIIGNGLTILASRQRVIDYSMPTFPSAVWLLARADSGIKPIVPSGDLAVDIRATKARLKQGRTFVRDNSCIDPRLYDLEGKGYRLQRFPAGDSLNDIVPALVKKESEMSLLDVPDIIVAMEKWFRQVTVIGPISEEQLMGAGFRKSSPALRKAFDEFFEKIKNDGTYMRLIRKYYRAAPRYLPAFFKGIPEPGHAG